MSSASAVLGIAPFCLFGILGGLIAHHGRAGSLGRNSQFGYRTSQTKKSDAAWHAGQRAAAPMSQLVEVLSFVPAVAVLVLSLVGAGASAQWVMGGGYGVVVAGFVFAAVVAHRAAQKTADA